MRLRTNGTIRLMGVALAALALTAAACGKSNPPGSGGTTSAATSAPGGTSGGATSGPGGTGSGATVTAKSVGSLGTVLVDSRGFTLYHLDGETATKFVCTGGCAQAWPPLQAKGTPSGGAGATGTMSTAMRPDGITQVTYDGLPLYTFSGDTAPGQTNGEGVQGVWFAVTPDGKAAKGGSTSGGSSSGPGRY
jgi:predicted lipoprotein with Yx(FWY)xxD motif